MFQIEMQNKLLFENNKKYWIGLIYILQFHSLSLLSKYFLFNSKFVCFYGLLYELLKYCCNGFDPRLYWLRHKRLGDPSQTIYLYENLYKQFLF